MSEITGNSFKEREHPEMTRTETPMAPICEGLVEKPKKTGFLANWLKTDSNTIRNFLIETILIPGLINGISGIGDIVIDSLTEGVSRAFEKTGFLPKTGSSDSYVPYSSLSTGSRRRMRRYGVTDEYEDVKPTGSLTYDNIRVETRGKGEKVIAALRARIADPNYRYATVANLYELTGNIPPFTYQRWGWTSLNSADVVYSRHPEKPWLIRVPEPKELD